MVERLDERISQKKATENHPSQTSSSAEQKAALIKALTKHNESPLDPNNSNVKLVIQEIQRRFRPFHVPPVPQPISDADIDAAAEAKLAAEEAEKQAEEMQAKALEVEIEQQDQEHSDPYIQQVVLNVVQNSNNVQTEGFFTSHAAQIENSEAVTQEIEPVGGRRSIIGRRRRIGYSPVSGRRKQPGMYALSVKRQRRLKMKKHKYKKLMRRTRVIRRKLGQI